MSETQSIQQAKIENGMNTTPVAEEEVAAPKATPASAAFIASLRQLGTSWADVALGYGRVALENVAHALERTAERLGELQDKLKKGDLADPAPAS
jgi:hypothetical protein